MKNVIKDKNGKVIEFTINRRWWMHKSVEEGGSLLLDSESNRKCCLGFYGLACGVDREQIKDIGDYCGTDDPNSLPEQLNWLWKKLDHPWVKYGETKLAEKLVKANDAKNLKLAEKESKIKKLFAKKGIKVNFK